VTDARTDRPTGRVPRVGRARSMRGVSAPRIADGVRRADRRSVDRAGDCFREFVVRRTPEAVTGAVDRPEVRATDAVFFSIPSRRTATQRHWNRLR